MSFLAAMFVMFRREPAEETIFSHPIEAMMGMFIMSLGEFGDIYEQFDSTPHPDLGKVGEGLYLNLIQVVTTCTLHCSSPYIVIELVIYM